MNNIENLLIRAKNHPTKTYSSAAITLWSVGILSMTILTLKDVTHLSREYFKGYMIIKQDFVDPSKEGIRLPNITVCLRFYSQKPAEFSFENFTSYFNFSKFEFNQAFRFASRLHHVDYVTKTFRNWYTKNGDFQQIDRSPEDLLLQIDGRNYEFQYNEENLHKFWNYFGEMLCRNLNPKFAIVKDRKSKRILDVCQEAGKGTVPFTAVDERTVCFRIPLDLILIKSNDDMSTYTNDNDNSVLFGKTTFTDKQILFSFQPLLLRQLLYSAEPMLAKVGTHYKMMAFFPETPSIFLNPGFKFSDASWKAMGSKFYNEFAFDSGYSRSVWLPISFAIAQVQYKRGDTESCIDAYNKTNCQVKCIEEEFASACKCKRFMNRHYTQNSPFDQFPYCTPEHYSNCSDEYKTFKLNQNRQKSDCRNQCSKCSTISFNINASPAHVGCSVQPAWIRCRVFEEFLTKKLRNSTGVANRDVLREFCDRDLVPFQNHDLLDINEYENNTYDLLANEIMHFADTVGGNLKTTYYETLFGRVFYVLSVDTNNAYPIVWETPLMTEDGFRSQIGGIVGLYLGFSCFTGFKTLIRLVTYFKNRALKRLRKNQTLKRTVAVLVNRRSNNPQNGENVTSSVSMNDQIKVFG